MTDKRIVGYDFARALAIFGMVLVNFNVAMKSQQASGWLVNFIELFEGRAAALFVVLAGVGVSLLTKRARESKQTELIKEKRISLIKRGILLIVVGLSYSTIWQADILHFYGLYLVIAALLLNVSNRILVICAVGFVIDFILLVLIFDYDQGWNWQTLEYTDYWTAEGMIRNLFFNGFHPVFPWCAFLFIGMWLGRLDLTHHGIRRKLLFWSALLWAGTEILSKLVLFILLSEPLTEISQEEILALFGTAPIPPMPQYIIAASSLSVVIIILSIMISERFSNKFWMTALVKTGQLSLTFYVAHVVIGMGALEVAGRLENQTPEFILGATIMFNFSCIGFAYFWTSVFSKGPLEWVFRKLAG